KARDRPAHRFRDSEAVSESRRGQGQEGRSRERRAEEAGSQTFQVIDSGHLIGNSALRQVYNPGSLMGVINESAETLEIANRALAERGAHLAKDRACAVPEIGSGERFEQSPCEEKR